MRKIAQRLTIAGVRVRIQRTPAFAFNEVINMQRLGAATRIQWFAALRPSSRVACTAICLACSVTFAFALPFRWRQLAQPQADTLTFLQVNGISVQWYAGYVLFWEFATVLPWVVIGFIILRRCGDLPIALFSACTLVCFGLASGTLSPAMRTLLGINPWLDLLLHGFEFLAWYLLTIFFYIFPSNRFVPRWTRWLALAWLPIFLLWNFVPDSALAPLNWPPFLAVTLIGFMWLTWAASQVYRYRRVSNTMERQQTKWILLAMLCMLMVMTVTTVIGAFIPGYTATSDRQTSPGAFAYMLMQWPLGLLVALVPVSIAFSIMHYRLWDIDRLISRALVYGALTVLIILIYVLIVGGLGALFHGSSMLASLAATGCIAVLFGPLQHWLQQRVDRLMFGERDEPYEVLSRLSRRLDGAIATDALMPVIVTTIRQALKLPYVAVLMQENNQLRVVSASGKPSNSSLILPLSHQHTVIGELHAAQRAPGESFSPSERRLLETIAAQAGIVVHNVRLAADLQRSREALVSAREEERRRLRRDLHDGFGPRLAGQSLKLEAALELLDGDAPTARSLLRESLDESQALLVDIRRLVYGLRPPALDQLGLLSAIREQAQQYQLAGLRISIDAPEVLPALPAAVEVAAYRIVQEALTNVARHARASNCSVKISIDGALSIEICDDGCGLSDHVRAGVGLAAMRERAEEIGGTWAIERIAAGGTRVVAMLPLNAARDCAT